MKQHILIVPTLRQGEIWKSIYNDHNARCMSLMAWACECYERFCGFDAPALVKREAYEFLLAQACTKIAKREHRDAGAFTKQCASSIEAFYLWGAGKREELSPLLQEVMLEIDELLGNERISYFDTLDWIHKNSEGLKTHYSLVSFGFVLEPSKLKSLKALFVGEEEFLPVVQQKAGTEAVTRLYSDETNEINAIVEWVSEEIGNGRDPVVVVPNLSKWVPMLKKELTECVWPDSLWPGMPIGELPVEFGVVNYLKDSSVGRVIVNLMDAQFEDVSLSQWQDIALAQWISGAHQEKLGRNQLAHAIDNWPRRSLSCKEFEMLCQKHGCHQLKQVVSEFNLFKENSQGVLEWAMHWDSLITRTMDVECSINVLHASVIKQISECSNSFSALTSVRKTITGTEAWQYIKRVMSRTAAKRTVEKTLVRFYDAADCFGVKFSTAWYMRFDLSDWSKPETIPELVDRSALSFWGHSSLLEAEKRELIKQWMNALLSEENAVKSCASSYEKKLSAPFWRCNFQVLEHAHNLKSYLNSTVATLGEKEYESIVPWRQDGLLRRGQEWINTHNECPMKGFLKYRLGMMEQTPKYIGLAPRLFSLVFHKALEIAWKELKDSESLKALSSELFGSYANRWVEQARSELKDMQHISINDQLWSHASGLIVNLVKAHLKFHQQRDDIFRVVHCEAHVSMDFGPYEIAGVIDRVEEIQVEDASIRVGVDYKRFNVESSAWSAKRPRDLQLPQYLMNEVIPLDGISYEQSLSHDYVMKGLINGRISKDIKSQNARVDFDETKTKLFEIVSNCADEISKGVCSPKPLNECIECSRCQFNAVCHRQ